MELMRKRVRLDDDDERDVKSPVEAWRGSDEGPCGERLDESFVSTVGEDEEWEESGEWGQVGGAPWEVLGVG